MMIFELEPLIQQNIESIGFFILGEVYRIWILDFIIHLTYHAL